MSKFSFEGRLKPEEKIKDNSLHFLLILTDGRISCKSSLFIYWPVDANIFILITWKPYGQFHWIWGQKEKEIKLYQNSESEHFEREFVFVENIRSQLLTNHLPPNLFIPWDIFTCTTAHVYTPPLPLTNGQTAPLFVSTHLYRPPPFTPFLIIRWFELLRNKQRMYFMSEI